MLDNINGKPEKMEFMMAEFAAIRASFPYEEE